MKKRQVTWLLVSAITPLCILPAKAQVISKIDFSEIRQLANKPGKNNYEALIERLLQADTTMLPADYRCIYYSQVFEQKYQPLNENTALRNIQELVAAGKLEVAATKLNSYLIYHPASLGGIYDKMVILLKKNDTEAVEKWKVIYRGLIQAILDSGDGKTEATAMVIANISDQYKVLPALGVKSAGHVVTGNRYDKQLLDRPTKDGLNTLFFNITTILSKEEKQYH